MIKECEIGFLLVLISDLLLDLAGDSNVEGFATPNSVFRKNAPSTPQELQANLQNTPNGASSGRLHFDAQVSLSKPPKN